MEEKDRQPTSRDMDTVRFISLVSMFASSAYSSMGKIANPATGEIERDLDAARGFIDILVMLKTKTEGNLTKEEERLIASTVSDLQLNFVREKDKPESAPEGKEKTEQEEPPAPEPAAGEKEPGKEEPGAGKKTGSGPIVTPTPEAEEEGRKGTSDQ